MAYPDYGWQTGPATTATPGSVLNFRTGAGTNYPSTGTIPHGTSINLTGSGIASGGYNWYPATWGGNNGYVAGQYLMGSPASAPATSPAPPTTPDQMAGQVMNQPGSYPNLGFNPTGSPFNQGGSSWYYDPASNYGGDRDWATTPAMGGPAGYLENNPNALYTRFFSPWASGEDAFSRWVRSQYGNTRQGYEAAFASNPDLTYGSYMSGLGPGHFANRWQQMNPQQRGESTSLFGGGRLQWIT